MNFSKSLKVQKLHRFAHVILKLNLNRKSAEIPGSFVTPNVLTRTFVVKGICCSKQQGITLHCTCLHFFDRVIIVEKLISKAKLYKISIIKYQELELHYYEILFNAVGYQENLKGTDQEKNAQYIFSHGTFCGPFCAYSSHF